MKKFLLLPLMLLAVGSVKAQNGDSTKPTDEEMVKLKAAVTKLGQVNVVGYVQAQYQWTDSNTTVQGGDVGSVEGGPFSAGAQSRFLIRRSYIKADWKTGITEGIVNLECANNSAGAPTVNLKQAIVKVTEPWTKMFGLSMGLQDHPFGVEVNRSSAVRESPERSRIIQTLFPGDMDLGAELDVLPGGDFSFVTLKTGFFNGRGLNLKEDNDGKNWVGRLGLKAPLANKDIGLEGGVSWYLGNVTDFSDSAFDKVSGGAMQLSTGTKGKDFDRQYFDVDLMASYKLPVVGPLALRGEFVTGKQPGTSGSASYYNSNDAKGVLYERNFMGWYVMATQNLGDLFQVVLKYDAYDPNTDVEGSDIAAAGHLGFADLAFNTFGGGVNYLATPNLKFTAYWSMPMNEEAANLGAWAKDVTDDVFTLRAQYLF